MRRTSKDSKALMFRDLPDWLQDILRLLSRDGYIYIGRTGVGLTYDFRHACMKLGTIKAIDQTMEYHNLEEKILVELIAMEGPRWVPYNRILQYCRSEPLSLILQKSLSP